MAEGPFGRRSDAPPPEPPPGDVPEARAEGPRPQPPKPPPGAASQATWILGVVIVLVLGYITFNTLRTQAPGSRGLEIGAKLPPFAAPLAGSSLDGDANIAVRASEQIRQAACDVRRPDVFNSCQAAERGPLVLGFTAVRSERCLRQIDLLDRLRTRFADVQFAVVAIKGDRADLRREVARRGWKLPVAHDRDGAVANVYAVSVCPAITFASRGGEVRATTLGEASAAEIERAVETIR
ncbi:MAG TPA: hypothetical protein VM266_00755 [Solirubrobacteraceae bacterium]|nr:hypothetical protein [Solirubrobacteraceae bacterium]